MLPNVDPYRLLEQIARNRSEIKLLNIYKGLPISHDVRINSIDNAEIQVLSNRHQLACLYHQRETYLQGAELPFILRSQVVSLHLGRESAILTNIVVAQNGIGERTQIRVEPDEPLLAVVKFDGSSADFSRSSQIFQQREPAFILKILCFRTGYVSLAIRFQ